MLRHTLYITCLKEFQSNRHDIVSFVFGNLHEYLSGSLRCRSLNRVRLLVPTHPFLLFLFLFGVPTSYFVFKFVRFISFVTLNSSFGSLYVSCFMIYDNFFLKCGPIN